MLGHYDNRLFRSRGLVRLSGLSDIFLDAESALQVRGSATFLVQALLSFYPTHAE
jgi:hypothetical protein